MRRIKFSCSFLILGTDGKSIEKAERQRVLDRLVLTSAKFALAENLHLRTESGFRRSIF